MSYGDAFPFSFGGAEADAERIWRELRKLIGEGGPGPEGGLEDLWRQCKAQAIAAALGAYERAVLQAFPQTATDHLPLVEKMLGTSAATPHERRAAATTAYTRELGADVPTLRAELQQIDARFDVLDRDPATVETTQLGKTFEGRGDELIASAKPNYSGFDEIVVTYDLADGDEVPPATSLAAAESYLNEALPSWVDHYVIAADLGFYLDESPLDFTGFD